MGMGMGMGKFPSRVIGQRNALYVTIRYRTINHKCTGPIRDSPGRQLVTKPVMGLGWNGMDKEWIREKDWVTDRHRQDNIGK